MTKTDIWLIGAAIAQAVLSAAAVIVAVLINGTTVRRLAAERRQEREDERANQLRALGQAIISLKFAAHAVRRLDCAQGEQLEPNYRRNLIAAGRAISHRLEAAPVSSAGLLVCLTVAEQLVGEASGVLANLGAPGQKAANDAMLELDGFATEIAKVVSENHVQVPA